MQITIAKSDLAKALGHIARIVEKRNFIPILGNVLLRAEGGRLSLKGTDLDIEATESVPAAIGASGATTVPAQMFHDIVRKLPDGADVAIAVDAEKGAMTIRAGRSRFTLHTLPVDDFPDLATGTFIHRFTLPADGIKSVFGRTSFAISSEETRYYLGGVYLHPVDGFLRGVATDGHRLARVDLPMPDGADAMPGVIIPRKTVAEVQRLIDKASGDVVVEVSATKIRFSIGGTVLTSKLIDGTFPDYQRVIPNGNDKLILADRAEFAAAVDRVKTVLSAKTKAIKLAFLDATLAISVVDSETGSASEELAVEYGAEPMEIGFNASYLSEIMGTVEGDNVVVMLGDPGSPTMFRAEDDASALYVLMPMRVN